MQVGTVTAQPYSTGAGQGAPGAVQSPAWLESLANALKKGQTSPAGQAPQGASSPAQLGGLDDALTQAVRSRVEENEEVQAFLAELDDHWQQDPVAQKEAQVLEKLQQWVEGEQNFSLNIPSAVYEKMAADPAFDSQMQNILDKVANHPWMTEDIPGLVARSVHINENGEVLVCILVEAPSQEDHDALAGWLQELLDEAEEEMHSVWLEDAGTDKSYEQMMREVAEAYWEQRKEQAEAI